MKHFALRLILFFALLNAPCLTATNIDGLGSKAAEGGEIRLTRSGDSRAPAPLIDKPMPVLTLTNGRILYDAQAKGFAGKVVMVRHRDGAETVAYDLFPSELQGQLAAKRPRERTYSEMAEASRLAELNRPKPVVKGNSGRTYNGLRVDSVMPVGSFAKVTITNTTSYAQSVRAWNLIGRSTTGEFSQGSDWVGLDSDGKVVVVRKSKLYVPPGASVELVLTFQTFMAGTIVESVDWK